ncbi:NodT family efflux transporter outer membrane factor (OMF) lipoprotein [Acinetobacter calcoaceticus]|uniref:NodT family efflux transporter outer membrane factor (OMF) lipoprotein n=1 Tax=Acinetobacter calcoaceticus TaxID=471 RepID=A0A4R1XTV7_ACICA|nr:NodT family efflux transporter outer membrane factor (OMF) lipoprotein [Acinetobacter calcoaceticus]
MKLTTLSIVLLLTPLFSACQSNRIFKAADYQAPQLHSPTEYRYAGVKWVPMSTSHHNADVAQSEWWLIYQDPILNDLMQQLNRDNLSLQQAAARYRQAQGLLQQQQANRLPSLDAHGSSSRGGVKQQSDRSQFDLGLKASWVPDLWGRVAKAIEGQQANLQASAADLAAVKLNQQLLAAESYWALRSLDQQLVLLAQTQSSFQRAYQILNDQFQAGMIARADVIQAETQLKQIGLQQLSRRRDRALQENILAALLGQTVNQFTLKSAAFNAQPPQIATQIPSRLLSQRPDVIQAERELAASHAALGLAQTAWLPDISIGLDASINHNIFNTLLQSPHYLWSMGLEVAGNIYDGAKRRADIMQAQAVYEQRLAAYKMRVLNGWKEVEDALLQAESFRLEAIQQQQILALAMENQAVVTRRYQAGMISYLEVVVAQNQRLEAEQNTVQRQQRQMQNSVQLIAALGGPLAPSPNVGEGGG